LAILEGNSNIPDNIIFKKNNQIFEGKIVRERGSSFEIPIPCHEKFPYQLYHYPFCKRHPFATVLTDYGCPFRCDFCVMPGLGYKYRSVDNIIKELQYIRNLGIREVYFEDQTFGALKKHTEQLLQAMISEKLIMSWVCFTRVDLLNEERIELMKKAGCHTVIMGVESANQITLNNYHKGLNIEEIKSIFKLCKKHGLRTVGTFIVGLSGKKNQFDNKIGFFARELGCDFASFNIPVPRAGTKFNAQSLDREFIRKPQVRDQSGVIVNTGFGEFSAEELKSLHRKAIKDFYFRPGYFLKQLTSIRTLYQFYLLVRGGWDVIKQIIRGG